MVIFRHEQAEELYIASTADFEEDPHMEGDL
jgi:hypothetical protein